jgi:hypothetical protein
MMGGYHVPCDYRHRLHAGNDRYLRIPLKSRKLRDGENPASTRIVLSTPVIVTARPTKESHAAKPVGQPSP